MGDLIGRPCRLAVFQDDDAPAPRGHGCRCRPTEAAAGQFLAKKVLRNRRTRPWAVQMRWLREGPVREAACVIGREAAIQAVEDQLERDYQKWRAASADAMRMAVVRVEEHELVWIVSWQSEEFVRTRNPAFALAGNGPYLVDRVDGGLHQIGVVSAKTGEWEADYRARIRGLPVRTAVDDLHDALCEVAAARGRMHAVRTLRQRLPMLSPAEAIEYVSALLDGDVPGRLVAVAAEELVKPCSTVPAVATMVCGPKT
ncbi:YrhB domain-containing protein [Streptomyces sp. NPDC101145]|uniref:YrhB domain-containing protein n=1 Tax=Streptomyces sp. NPDC101145 TaxID=3366112 RepID=UPI00381AA5FE